MKLRQGHVSNSSSSSFVLVTTKENFEAAKAKSSALGVVAAESIASFKKIGTQEVVLLFAEGYDGVYFEGADFDVPKKTTRTRGCDHPEVQGADFCPKCGNETWIEEDEYESVEEAFREFADALREDEDAYL